MLCDRAMLAIRHPHTITLRDAGPFTRREVCRILRPTVHPDLVFTAYWNRKTGRKTFKLHFRTEEERDQALDLVYEKFQNFSVP